MCAVQHRWILFEYIFTFLMLIMVRTWTCITQMQNLVPYPLGYMIYKCNLHQIIQTSVMSTHRIQISLHLRLVHSCKYDVKTANGQLSISLASMTGLAPVSPDTKSGALSIRPHALEIFIGHLIFLRIVDICQFVPSCQWWLNTDCSPQHI